MLFRSRAIGYNSDTEKNSTLVIIGHKGSTAETYAAGESFAFHNVADPLTHYASVEPTCINEGNIEYWHCNVCGKDFSNEAGTVVSGETKIEKIRIKMTQGIFIEDVLFDAYNPKTKIPLKILVNKFMTSAYSLFNPTQSYLSAQ